jgi:two-component system cell cycle response regulator DivK
MTQASILHRDPGLSLVLLVDRNDDAREMYGSYLEQQGLSIEEAADGRVALAKAVARVPDIVVTDTRLPGLNGFELCQLLRRDTATASTPIVVVTADGYPPDVKRAYGAGADLVLVKPCLPQVLLDEMRRLVARSKELKEQSQRLRARAALTMARTRDIQARVDSGRRKPYCKAFDRHFTSTPEQAPPALLCPECDQPLVYQRSHIGGVSERNREQWDYYECPSGCGSFQHRQRTRKLRKIS